ncbi:hypothetical protein PybrP1_012196 [[Pythium] brassicae (nom. inval.)]|nr:hypothetical protein PybrP1_012196 [[Pythium] brassicae (nom. inval.)]
MLSCVLGVMYALHFQKTRAPYLFRSYSLCPDEVVHHLDVARLLASAFLHVDDWHLYHNMASFLWKGYHLEHRLGSIRFAAAIGCLLVLAHGLVVVVAFVLVTFFDTPEPFYQCSIGFSAVLFALKVPTKYAAWLELVAIHYLVPHSSFLGHMCGILAGYIYVLTPGAQRLTRSLLRFCECSLRRLSRSRPPSASQPSTPSRSTARPTTYESDEMLARRLQEEEYRAASTGRDNRDGGETHSGLSQDELRRRRVDRLNRGSR